MHPPRADDEVRVLGEDEGREIGVVCGARGGGGGWKAGFVGQQVVVGCGDGVELGAGEAVGGFFVGDDVRYCCGEEGGGGERGVDEGLQVGAGAGD